MVKPKFIIIKNKKTEKKGKKKKIEKKRKGKTHNPTRVYVSS